MRRMYCVLSVWLCFVSLSDCMCSLQVHASQLPPVAILSHAQHPGPVAAPMVITPPETHTHIDTDCVRQAALTACLITSAELIFRLEKFGCHQSSVLVYASLYVSLHEICSSLHAVTEPSLKTLTAIRHPHYDFVFLSLFIKQNSSKVVEVKLTRLN